MSWHTFTQSLHEIVPRYCATALAASSWAEPLIALANLAFVSTAILCARDLHRQRYPGIATALLRLLILEITGIGAASLLFHVMQTRWSRSIDLAAIALFMVTFAGLASLALGQTVRSTGGWLALFAAACIAASTMHCGTGRCLSGTLSYTPALAGMIVIGWRLGARYSAARSLMLPAAAVFLGGLVVRALSFPLCETPAMFRIAAVTLVMLRLLLQASFAYLDQQNLDAQNLVGIRRHR
jgi:hypothetical protein